MKEIIGISICLLLVGASTLPVTGYIEKSKIKRDNFRNPVIIQPPDELWNRTYGGAGGDSSAMVQQTMDGGYVLAGSTTSFGAGIWDFWLIKTDTFGNENWNKTFGGESYDVCKSGQQTLDGGYVLLGDTMSYGTGNWDFWLVKTDSTGNEQWNKTFGGPLTEFSASVQQTIDGGYILTGTTEYENDIDYGDFWLVKTDENGYEQWNKKFGGVKLDDCYSVCQTFDGGYILTGFTRNFGAGKEDVWLVKTDENGDMEWDVTFGGKDDDVGYSVEQTEDGGYIITGITGAEFNTPKGDIWLIKTDENGDEQWNKTFGGTSRDYGRSVQQTFEDGYIVLGNTYSFGAGEYDLWLIKTDEYGDEQWSKIMGGNGTDGGRSIQQISDGGYIIAGSFTDFWPRGPDYDVWLIRIETESFPPSAPNIDGPISGKKGIEHDYTFNAVDLNGDDVYYFIEWGDDTIENWIGPYESGENVTISHAWKKQGNYSIRARAKDIYSVKGPWTSLEVSIPKSKSFNFIFSLLERWFERIPNAFSILIYLLGLK